MIEMSSWFRNSLLNLNCDNLFFTIFNHPQEWNATTVTSTSLITNINSTRFLGLKIDGTLSWREHVAELTPKLNKAYVMLLEH